MANHSTPGRRVGALCGYLVAVVLLACMTSPYLFNLLMFCGRRVDMLAGLRRIEFHEIISRLAMIYVVLGFIPFMRVANISSLETVGLVKGMNWKGALGRGMALGVCTLGILLGWGWLLDAYHWDPAEPARLFSRLAAFGVGVFIIGYLEELFFRGTLFGMLRQAMPVVPAALIIGLLFSAIHFVDPEYPNGIVHGHWYTGFSLLPHLFGPVHDNYADGFFFINLLLIHLVLSAYYHRQGHIYFIIGLHAGWVFTLQGGRLLLDRDATVLYALFGMTDNVARSAAATCMLLLFLGHACWIRRANADTMT